MSNELDPSLPKPLRDRMMALAGKRPLGIFHDGKVYLFANRIAPGREFSVLMHELGVHAGWRHMVDAGGLKGMADTIGQWASRSDGTPEARIARAAMERVANAERVLGKAYDPAMRGEESVAYFVEEAVRSGMDPRTIDGSSPAGRLLRRVWTAVKQIAKRFGIGSDKLSAQDIVDFAYGAANKALDFGARGDETAHTFVGERARTHDVDKFLLMMKAQRLDAEHVPAGEIWKQTGWHKGVDGKWRHEISDHAAKLKPAFHAMDETSGLPLHEVLDHPDLFSAYPHLRNVLVTRQLDANDGGPSGGADEANNRIEVARNLPDREAMQTVLHEMQHMVQKTEGFAKGTADYAQSLRKPVALQRLAAAVRREDPGVIRNSMRNADPKRVAALLEKLAGPEAQARLAKVHDDLDAVMQKMYDARNDFTAKGNALDAEYTRQMEIFNKAAAAGDPTAQSRRAAFEQDIVARGKELVEGTKTRLKALEETAQDMMERVEAAEHLEAGGNVRWIRKMLYSTAAGEVESRNVEARMDMTPEERAQTPPSATADVHRLAEYVPTESGTPYFSLDGADARDAVPPGEKIDEPKARARFAAIDQMAKAATKRMPEPVHAALRQVADRVHETLFQSSKRVLKGFMTLRDLQRNFGHIDGVNEHARAIFDSGATVHREQLKYARVHDAMMRLPMKTRLALGSMMEVAKRTQVHPDLPLSDPLNKHLGDPTDPDAIANWGKVHEQWEKLGSMPNGRAAQVIYGQARDVLQANYKARLDLLRQKAEELGVKMPQTLERNGPYFPSTRDDAPYAVIWRSARMNELDPDSAEASLLKSDPDHYVVTFEPTARAAERTAALMAQQGKTGAKVMERAQYQRNTSALSQAFMDKLESTLQSNGADSATIKAVRDLYLQALPATHSVTSRMSYKAVAGIRPAEMIHGFARAAMSDSFHLASLLHNDRIVRTLGQIKRADPDGSIYNLMQKRFAMLSKSSQNKFASAMTNFTYLNMLGSNPAFLTMQGVQPWMLGLPLLAAKDGVGFNEAVAQLGRGTAQAMKMIKLLVKDNGWRYELDSNTFRRAGLSDNETALLNQMLDSGLLDITGSMDFASGEPGVPAAHAALMKAATIAPHMIEQIDRMGLALATHRALMKAGRTHEDAAAAAHDVVASSMFDYSRENTPYLMMPGHLGGLNRLFMQFRKYQQGVVTTMIRNFGGAMKGDKEAMRATFGLLATHALMAGAAGLPLAFPIASLAKLVSLAWPSDDRPDPDAWFAHFLNSSLGLDASLALRKGIPALLGVDLSTRLGAGDIFNPVPYARWSGTANDSFKDFLASSIAPVMGTVSNTLRGLDAMSQGDMAKGFGLVLPKFVGDFAKAYALASHGVVTKYGDQAISPNEVSPGDVAATALGFQPTKLTQYYDAQQRVGNRREAVKDARSHLIGAWVTARLNNDRSAEQDARQAISEFNGRHNGLESVLRINSSQLFQSLQRQREQQRARTASGAILRSNEQWLKPSAR